MAVNVWRFQVKEDYVDEFIRMNQIDWPAFFKKSPAYQGTQVLPHKGSLDYTVADYWTSENAFLSFKVENLAEFNALDARHKELYSNVVHIGFFR